MLELSLIAKRDIISKGENNSPPRVTPLLIHLNRQQATCASIARIESLLPNITYESRCATASGEHGLRAVALCFQFHFQTFPPTTPLSQTNRCTEPPICFSTGHDIRAARFNAATRYSRACTFSTSLSLSLSTHCNHNVFLCYICRGLAITL